MNLPHEIDEIDAYELGGMYELYQHKTESEVKTPSKDIRLLLETVFKLYQENVALQKRFDDAPIATLSFMQQVSGTDFESDRKLIDLRGKRVLFLPEELK